MMCFFANSEGFLGKFSEERKKSGLIFDFMTLTCYFSSKTFDPSENVS